MEAQEANRVNPYANLDMQHTQVSSLTVRSSLLQVERTKCELPFVGLNISEHSPGSQKLSNCYLAKPSRLEKRTCGNWWRAGTEPFCSRVSTFTQPGLSGSTV